MGTSGKGEDKRPVMQVVCQFMATCTSQEDFHFCQAYLRDPKVDCTVLVKGYNEPVLCTRTTTITVLCWIDPPVVECGEPFKSTLTVVDEYDKKYHTKIVCMYHGKADVWKKADEKAAESK